MTGAGQALWLGGILYVDDFCLISTNPEERREMIHECQRWSEDVSLQLNAKQHWVVRTAFKSFRRRGSETF